MDPTKDRESQDLLVEVMVKIEKDTDGYPRSRDVEALLCQPLDPECSECIVKSIPFYVRNLAYGDTIRTRDDPNGDLEFAEMLHRGGFSVYRIFLHDPILRDEVIKKLLELDALVEREGNLIAIAVGPSVDVDSLVDYMLDGKGRGAWGVQDGYIFENPA